MSSNFNTIAFSLVETYGMYGEYRTVSCLKNRKYNTSGLSSSDI